jgi:hypothetical protein
MLLPGKYVIEHAYKKEIVWYKYHCRKYCKQGDTNLRCNCFPLFLGKESEYSLRKQQQSYPDSIITVSRNTSHRKTTAYRKRKRLHSELYLKTL